MMDNCENCGFNDWEFLHGVACCNECGTSSQSLVKEQHKEDVATSGRGVRLKQENKSCTKDEGYKWRLDEGLTVVLKKYVQVLIKLGASKHLSTTALQVWKQLLQSKKLTVYKSGKGQSVNGLMLPCLVSVLHVSCLLLNQQFYPSDLIRWIREEHLPYISSLNVLPETWKKASLFDGFFVVNSFFWPNHSHVRNVTQFYLDILQVKPKLDWDFSIIIQRQLEEMQLPADLNDLAKQICQATLQGLTTEKLAQVLLSKDILSMAAIIVSLKIMIGLNGLHEEISIEKTETMNYKRESSTSNIKGRMFIWSDWVKYIELRRALVKYVSPSQHKHLFSTCNDSGTRMFPAHKFYQYLVRDDLQRSMNMIASRSETSGWKPEPSFYATWGVLYQYLRSHAESSDLLYVNYNTETRITRGREGKSTVTKVEYEPWYEGGRFLQYMAFTKRDSESTDNTITCTAVADVSCSSYWRSSWDKDARDNKLNAHLMCQHFPSIYLWLLELCAEILQTTAIDLQEYVDLIDRHVFNL